MTNSRMTKNVLGSAFIGAVLLASAFFSTAANAAPPFARQTGMQCSNCHSQDFPALNAFGRSYRATGYTITGSQAAIEGDNIAFQSVFNTGIIGKLQYRMPSGTAATIVWPDESAFLVGGRVSENIGFLMELGLFGPVIGTTGAVGTPIAADFNGFLSSKMHFNLVKGDTNVGLVLFSTDGLGVGYGFELLNTGAQRSQRPVEDRGGYSAMQALGTASGAATGAAFVATNNNWFVNASLWTPGWFDHNLQIDNFATYLRAAYTGSLISGWDTAIGFGMSSGTVTDLATTLTSKTDMTFFDFQMQGNNMPLNIYVSYGTRAAGHYAAGVSTTADSAYALAAKYAVNNKVRVYAAMANTTVGAASSSTTTIGASYMLAQNVKVEFYNHAGATAAASYNRLMLFVGL